MLDIASFPGSLPCTPFLAANVTLEPGGSKVTFAARNGAGDGREQGYIR